MTRDKRMEIHNAAAKNDEKIIQKSKRLKVQIKNTSLF